MVMWRTEPWMSRVSGALSCGYSKRVESCNILIVEDEMITLLDLRKQLRRLGYRVSGVARSGEEAVRLTEELNPDLVIMDVKLAGNMDGVEASRQIQKSKHIPVLYLTAYPNVFVQSAAQMEPPYLCISKPFSLPDLKAIIEVALVA